MDTLYGHEDAVSKITMNSQQDCMVSSSWDASIKQWKFTPSGFQNIPLHIYAEHDAAVECVQYDTQASYLFASGCTDGMVAIYDTRVKKSICTIASAHNATVTDLAFLDANTLVSCSKDMNIRVSKLNKSGEAISTISTKDVCNALIVGSDKTIAVGGDAGAIKVFQTDMSNEYQLQHTIKAHTAPITTLSYANNILATGSKDGQVILWE